MKVDVCVLFSKRFRTCTGHTWPILRRVRRAALRSPGQLGISDTELYARADAVFVTPDLARARQGLALRTQSNLTDVSTKYSSLTVLPFSKLNNFILDTLIHKIIF